jgi:hypothetical protein
MSTWPRKFTPQGAHYLENHRRHLMFVKPDERPFVTAELIRLTTFTFGAPSPDGGVLTAS